MSTPATVSTPPSSFLSRCVDLDDQALLPRLDSADQQVGVDAGALPVPQRRTRVGIVERVDRRVELLRLRRPRRLDFDHPARGGNLV